METRRRIMPVFAASLRALALAAAMLACAPAPAQPYGQGLLWRVEKPGAAPSHLFGTIHLDDRRVTNLPPPVQQALDGARSFTLEVSLEPPNVVELASRMVYSDGRTLPQATGDDLYRRVVPLLEKNGLPEPAVRMFKPWAVMLLLVMPQQNAAEVLDFRLLRAAQARGLPVRELETVGDQVAAFERLTERDQVVLLRQTVDTHARFPQLTERLVGAYLQRDLAAMWRINEEQSAGRPELAGVSGQFAQKLVFDRNRLMAERMQPQLAAGGAFVALGALHLYGEQGVLRLLERQGWRVIRIY